MAHRDGNTSGVLELLRSAAPIPARRMAALAALARPAGEVTALLFVEVLRSPRARAAVLGLARSLARRVAARRAVPSGRVELSVTAWRVTVVEECGVGVADVLFRRVEALASPDRAQRPPAR
jgi:hypothetical protein